MSTLKDYRDEKRRDRQVDAQLAQDAADREAARRRADEAHILQLKASAQAEQDARRRVDQAQRDARKAALREDRRARREQAFGKLPELGMSALWATMIVLPLTLAWGPQATFAADNLHIPGPFNHLFPAVIECAAWLCAFEAHRRGRRGDPVGSLRRWMWVLAGIAAAINAAHGIEKDGPAAGLALGALSLLGVLLHSIRQGLDTAKAAGRNHGLEIWRRIRYPRLSLAAASIRAARELDQETAWELAWIDRFGVGPDASRRERILGTLITARELKVDRQAAKSGDLAIVGGRVQRAFVSDVREYVDAERAAARAEAEAVIHSAQDALTAAGLLFGPDAFTETTADSTLGARAAELLPMLQDAIRNGDLPAAPGVKRIQSFVRDERGLASIGVPTAQELRNALSSIRVVSEKQAAS